jgi:hypothetical protein
MAATSKRRKLFGGSSSAELEDKFTTKLEKALCWGFSSGLPLTSWQTRCFLCEYLSAV